MARSVAIGALGCTWACTPVAPPQSGSDCPAEPACEGNTLVACADGGVSRTPCGTARCASDAPVAQCVPAAALPCDPESPPLRCENGRIVDCAEDTLYYLARACDPGQFCVGEDNPRCVEAAGAGCNPDFWTSLCIEGERFDCSPQGQVEVVEADCSSG